MHILDRIDFPQSPRLTDTCHTDIYAAMLEESSRCLTWLRRLVHRLAKGKSRLQGRNVYSLVAHLHVVRS
jgi:beta-galactosidase beta subunit